MIVLFFNSQFNGQNGRRRNYLHKKEKSRYCWKVRQYLAVKISCDISEVLFHVKEKYGIIEY
jgi:hypothetical protein